MSGNSTRLRGLNFERKLIALHAIYKDQGVARVWKNPLSAEYRGKKLVAFKSLPDFTGELAPYGRSVAFDAKVITPKANGKSIYSHDKRRAHQAQWLLETTAFGGIGFILVCDDFKRHFILWPQPHWALNKGWSVNLDCGNPTICQKVPCLRGEYPDWFGTLVETGEYFAELYVQNFAKSGGAR